MQHSMGPVSWAQSGGIGQDSGTRKACIWQGPYGEMWPVWHEMTGGLAAMHQRFVNSEAGDVGEGVMNSLPHSVHWKVLGILGTGNCAI